MRSYIARICLGKRQVYVKETLHLKMGPVIKRIAYCGFEGLGVGFELFIIPAVAGYEFRPLRLSHKPPFIVIAAQPCFGYCVKSAVVGYLRRV